MEYEEIYDENGYVINKIPYIKNEIIKANNIKEIIEEKFFYEVLNIKLDYISSCCLGGRKTSKGYIFKFKNDKEILSKYKEIIGGKE